LITIRSALRPLKELFGYSSISDFTPLQLKVVRQAYIDKGMARKSVNDYTGVIKHCFKWGVEEALVPHTVYGALHVVSGLRKGRTEAPEGKPVTPVSEDAVEATMKFLPSQIQALIRLQLLTGARPGELIGLRPLDFDTSSELWVVKPEHHKTAHHGLARIIHFGPKAQSIVKTFMEGRPLHMPLFSPKDARKGQSDLAPSHRRPDQRPTPGPAPLTGSIFW